MTNLKEKSYKAGYEAAKNDTASAPVMCKTFKELTEDFNIKDGFVELAKEWHKGFNARIDEELSVMFD